MNRRLLLLPGLASAIAGIALLVPAWRELASLREIRSRPVAAVADDGELDQARRQLEEARRRLPRPGDAEAMQRALLLRLQERGIALAALQPQPVAGLKPPAIPGCSGWPSAALEIRARAGFAEVVGLCTDLAGLEGLVLPVEVELGGSADDGPLDLRLVLLF
jgi:hypothetical protein